jgi:hypothetical protein
VRWKESLVRGRSLRRWKDEGRRSRGCWGWYACCYSSLCRPKAILVRMNGERVREGERKKGEEREKKRGRKGTIRSPYAPERAPSSLVGVVCCAGREEEAGERERSREAKTKLLSVRSKSKRRRLFGQKPSFGSSAHPFLLSPGRLKVSLGAAGSSRLLKSKKRRREKGKKTGEKRFGLGTVSAATEIFRSPTKRRSVR